MEHAFWHSKWAKNEIGFHESKPNPFLTRWLDMLRLAQNSRIFLPLCGKTLDIGWLLSHGHRVAGIELDETAVRALFNELGVEPATHSFGKLKLYTVPGLDVFTGDIFNLTREIIGCVDAVYDRAALVALPQKIRNKYAKHLILITRAVSQLLITYEYEQSVMAGPPFSVNREEVLRLYSDKFSIACLESVQVKGGFKGKYPAKEHVWLLDDTAKDNHSLPS